MTMKKILRRVGWVVILWLLPIAGWAQSSAIVQMAGYHQVPSVETPASGVLDITLKADTLIVKGNFRDLTGVFRSSGLYFGEPGQRGNRLMGLKVELEEDRRGGRFLAKVNRLELRSSILQALKRGHLYVNVGSERRPHGEIRGQIPPMTSDSESEPPE